jgi:hypothetical protein
VADVAAVVAWAHHPTVTHAAAVAAETAASAVVTGQAELSGHAADFATPCKLHAGCASLLHPPPALVVADAIAGLVAAVAACCAVIHCRGHTLHAGAEEIDAEGADAQLLHL